eukprot:Opistho-2@18715
MLSMSAMRRLRAMRPARYMGFVTSFFFALATLVFPGGFDSEYVGGKAFKLPEGTTVGYSYILFIMSTLLVFVGELFFGEGQRRAVSLPRPLALMHRYTCADSHPPMYISHCVKTLLVFS